MTSHPPSSAAPIVGILILNYHQPEATRNCIQRLLEIEGPDTIILWLENDAQATRNNVIRFLNHCPFPWESLDPEKPSLPPPGHVGVLFLENNLGYAGGNNVGLRLLDRLGVEFTWVMNNDTLVTEGSSKKLVEAARNRPEIGLWGMKVHDLDQPAYLGLRIRERDFAVTRLDTLFRLEQDPWSFINGCAMFMRTAQACAFGGIPEEYFMYYEDQAFTWEYRIRKFAISAVESVDVLHLQSLSTGHRSRFVEYYCRRNRWHFIRTYFPSRLGRQKFMFFAYQMQKLFFRFRFDRIRLEWNAYQDFKKGRLYRIMRKL